MMTRGLKVMVAWLNPLECDRLVLMWLLMWAPF